MEIRGGGNLRLSHAPWYNEETLETNLHMIQDFLIPLVLDKEIRHQDEINEIFGSIRKNNMAKDSSGRCHLGVLCQAQSTNPWPQALVGELREIEVGISIGIEENAEELIELVRGFIVRRL